MPRPSLQEGQAPIVAAPRAARTLRSVSRGEDDDFPAGNVTGEGVNKVLQTDEDHVSAEDWLDATDVLAV